ncbi:NADH-quinone oxidoreductase subunit NuoE [Nocardioides aequoreus]|uniref:NADH-quinone oxidoreductase subunit NuoE n=1 Tax=Nocardioides aequoreus TaxID=397278 RepID=UPI0009FD1346|nr:NADH-quinone oxidoreductase subunit NuoE [Nocardioides aequoreus]
MTASDGASRIPGIDDGTNAAAVSTTAETSEPLDAATYAELREIGARYPQARSGLLPMLHLVQSVEGRVTSRGIEACAEILGISAAEVSGVATFYTMYKRRPVGDYHVGVCTNTLCAVMGGDLIFERLKEHLDVGNDETTDDGAITLEHVECNAACDYAPVMTVNWEFMDNMTPDSACALVDRLRAGEPVSSTRGPRLVTWRQAERVLAGFPDDLADEGPSAGPSSLVGLQIAREREWTAEARPDGDDDSAAEATAEQVDPASSGAAEGSHEAEEIEDDAAVAASDADVKHEDNPDNPGGDDK